VTVREPQDLGYGVHVITLTQGKFALVDSADAAAIGCHNWCAVKSGNGKSWYAVRAVRIDGRKALVQMHREILQVGPGLMVDHRNGDGLDNRRENIRQATASENSCNRGPRKINKCGYKGVDRHDGLWRARIMARGKRVELGSYETPELASAAYEQAAKTLHGEYRRCV
jgi:hypothetical protein